MTLHEKLMVLFSLMYVFLVRSNSRCAGGGGYLPEQADQGGSGPQLVRELPSASADTPGLQNPAVPSKVR